MNLDKAIDTFVQASTSALTSAPREGDAEQDAKRMTFLKSKLDVPAAALFAAADSDGDGFLSATEVKNLFVAFSTYQIKKMEERPPGTADAQWTEFAKQVPQLQQGIYCLL